jgi:carbon monoxide dehydrogenase subunit G
MKLEGSHTIDASRDRVWNLIIDPEVLKRCVPGCEALEAVGDNSYRMTLKAGVGSIKGSFQGSIKLEEMRPPEHYRMMVDGKGSAGFLKGSGALDLSEADGQTKIAYSGDVSVGGTIASVGQRMIQSSAKLMAAQFFTALEAEAAAVAKGVPPKHSFFGSP